MGNHVIEVVDLNKSYKLYNSQKDRLKEMLNPFGMYYHNFHALKNVTFKVEKGETLGIIGRNGAGKSTLLKVLTGVLSPTSGTFKVSGRIASLLELGAGFNPELTGRENILFYGLINGVTKSRMTDQMEAIVKFADIGEHVNQPVKTYSSGMFVRLAFATAIHTDPDVLIIDEALSVGDAKFQRKCYSKIADLKNKGVTILLVSHDLDAMKKHCNRAILLEGGSIQMIGEPKDIIVKYFEILYPKSREIEIGQTLELGHQFIDGKLFIRPSAVSNPSTYGVGGGEIHGLTISPVSSPNVLTAGQEIAAIFEFSWDSGVVEKLVLEEGLDSNISIGMALSDPAMNYIFGCNTFDSKLDIDPILNAKATVELKFRLPLLKTGDYFITLAIAVGSQKNHVQLKWYDGVGHVKVETEKEVYGIIAMEYKMELLEKNE
ncbi:MAG: ABC transporter ATP-binding protein [Bdellovibrionaceae bacterium]|nr:ABC transporter ATP-binding protein [Pseudobdellovibrionaceae bacterium]